MFFFSDGWIVGYSHSLEVFLLSGEPRLHEFVTAAISNFRVESFISYFPFSTNSKALTKIVRMECHLDEFKYV